MIIVRLKGGLGNQMFQHATAYSLVKVYNHVLKVNMSLTLGMILENIGYRNLK